MSEDNGSSVVECEIFIEASPDAVFRFLVEPHLMERWIGKSGGRNPRQREPFSLEMESGHVARGAYTIVSPPYRIAFTWGWEGQDAFPPSTSLVEIELVPKDGGTLVRLRHSGLPEDVPPLFSPTSHRLRWRQYLARLQTALSLQR